ncbi:MAG: hypothetical protein KDA69_01520 [Planctomycetaceae bacterium]|nr:hypothetical protein [Planctomycetaceae bacterium]MCA9029743.1 hypothetical protein [Planctomycetaceae bacterium]MCA9042966.1 hypothetical protein [Planctomycetaceae bacterium]MCB9952715.1 hypothetical protein [Planctomycetaceae bacterium]
MFIAVDFSENEVPSDVLELAQEQKESRASSDTGGDVGLEAVPGTRSVAPSGGAASNAVTAAQLDHWDVQTHQYRNEVAGSIGIFGALFSGKAKSVNAGVIQEAKRFCIRKTKEGRRVEFGVSVRLSVASNLSQADFTLSIPNIAASAQLESCDARIGLTVLGFTGPIGDMLPAPDDLNVTNYAKFTEAFQKIQAHVLGTNGENYLAPTVLGYSEAQGQA